jgi:outer membrane protein insertion porin family
LGGNQKTYRPTFEFKHFRPINRRRNTLAFRMLGAFVTGYGGQVPSPFSRFYVGGEDTIRGFNIRAVSPLALTPARSTIPIFFFDPTRLDANGNPTLQSSAVELLSQSISFPGGDTQVITNSEYRIPIAGPLTLSLFFDAGISTILRRGQLRLTDQRLVELNTLFPTADLSENLTLVPGTNGKVRVSTGVEIVINLPIVQAPFRLYWAYNLSRLNTTIVQPAGIIRTIEGFPLPPGVLEQQLLSQPQLLFLTSERSFFFNEPLKTFRFTISRTF